MSGGAALVLTAVGDLMFYGPLAERMAAARDLLWGFRPLGDALMRGDVLFGNFETPISRERMAVEGAAGKYFSPAGMGRALKQYGFDVVNLAHNHIYDFGAEGVETTIRELDEAGLAHIGIGRSAEEAVRPAIVTSGNGQRVGFVGYTTAHNALATSHAYVACFPEIERVVADVRELRAQVETVIVSCHTGAQYNPYPAPEARRIAQAAIEAGAAVYLGHHPHVPQGCERIGAGLAVYSLGDFVAPVHTEQTRRTFFVRITINGAAVAGFELVPCYISDACQTELAEGALRDEIARHLEEISAAIATGRSDALHFETAGSRMYSQYWQSWKREFARGGFGFLLRKLRNLRGYHLQLVWRTIVGRLRGRRSG